MDYEEKRELKRQVSQLLADAGLNQGVIKEMVEEEIHHKVSRAVTQVITHLNNQCSSGDYIDEQIRKYLRNEYVNSASFSSVLREELKNRVIQVVLKDVEEVKS